MGSASRIPGLGPRGEGWVVLQFLCLGAIVLLGLRELPDALIDPAARMPELIIGLAVMVVAGVVIGLGVLDLGTNLSVLPRPKDGGSLVQTGIYGRIRHPMYTGLIEGSLGWAAVTGSQGAFLVSVALAIVLDLKARREEAWLAERFPGYESYRRRTKRFIPAVY